MAECRRCCQMLFLFLAVSRLAFALGHSRPQPSRRGNEIAVDARSGVTASWAVARDVSPPLAVLACAEGETMQPDPGGGGVRWYEFRLDDQRNVKLYQQGTYCPGGDFRWMASPAIDGSGNIGIGFSFGGTRDFPGQRLAGRLADDPLGLLTLREAVLAEGQAAQTNTMRWEDYSQTALDPSDDHTIWYVGDYLKTGAGNYSTRIGAFRLK